MAGEGRSPVDARARRTTASNDFPRFEIPERLPLRFRIELAWKQRVLGAWRRRFGRLAAGRRARSFTGNEVLERLAALPTSVWSYDFEPGIRHLGPMAQDFAEMFGLGDTNRMINEVDANGVTMVAIQALYHRVKALEAEVARLKSTVSEQR